MAFLPQNYPQMYSGAYPIPQGYNSPNIQGQSYGQQQEQGMIWVDGEQAAKSYQMPPGWPANKPIPLYDTNDQVIYFKSISPMGMPNPIQKARYQMENQQNGQGISRQAGDYATREEVEKLRDEIREMRKEAEAK